MKLRIDERGVTLGLWSASASGQMPGSARIGRGEAELLLRGLLHDPYAMSRLRALLAHAGEEAVSRLEDVALIERAARALSVGRLVLDQGEVPELMPAPTFASGELEHEAPEPEPAPEPEEEKASVTFLVVDDMSGDPISDVALLITTPDGAEEEHTTDSEGQIQLDDIDPGACSVRTERGERTVQQVLAFDAIGEFSSRSMPGARRRRWERSGLRRLTPKGGSTEEETDLAICRVIEHRVRDGETLESVAETYELSASDLAKFNFGSDEQAEVERGLIRKVGCSRHDPDSGEPLFSASDEPGILYIPRELERGGLWTEGLHILRVHRIEPEMPLYVFSF